MRILPRPEAAYRVTAPQPQRPARPGSTKSHKAHHQGADSQYLFQQLGLAFVADCCSRALDQL
jgi:hypothetical protein